MATEDSIKRLEERLTRLEATLAQQPQVGPGGLTSPGGTVVDPAPWSGGGWGYRPPSWGGWGYHRWPTPVVDPGPFPTPIVDPGPFPPPVVADPAPYPWQWGGGPFVRQTAGTTLGRIGQIGDPPPIDVGRFSISQLESSLHTIEAEKARLNSMETMIKQQLDALKKQQGKG